MPHPRRTPPIYGRRMIALYFYCLLLGAVAVALAAIIATWPHWLPSLIW